MRRRIKHLQTQVVHLVEDKSDLQAHLQDQLKDIAILRDQLGNVVKENIDMGSAAKAKFIAKEAKAKINLIELKTVFLERNELKTKVLELEGELAHFKVSPSSSPSKKSNCSIDLPVQGPINKEPEDKLFPERRTSILRL